MKDTKSVLMCYYIPYMYISMYIYISIYIYMYIYIYIYISRRNKCGKPNYELPVEGSRKDTVLQCEFVDVHHFTLIYISIYLYMYLYMAFSIYIFQLKLCELMTKSLKLEKNCSSIHYTMLQ